ncbi:MAG: EscU/YscU/HrcU family type III secretion system export apparatus switch protein [Nocardioidaceae bacterium]
MSGEKTEKATPKKLKEGRKEGRTPRTPELGGWASMLVAAVLLRWAVLHVSDSVRELFIRGNGLMAHPDTAQAIQLLRDGLFTAGTATVVIGSGVAVVAVVSSVGQGGLHFATKAARPKLSRLNPLAGIKRIFGPQALWEAAKLVLKTSLVGLLVWRTVHGLMPIVGGLMPVDSVIGIVAGQVTALIRDVALAGLALAGADYAVQRRRTGKQLRMSKHEVKQEHRQAEGDPHLKGAIRSRQLAAARSRMMSAVPLADVVVTNPTHYAVALAYSPSSGAPRVVAKGAGVVAARIREAAREHRVPTVEDVPLARALHATCEIGQEIPAALFEAVAQVLAFVLTLSARGYASGHHRSPRSDLALPELPRGTRRRVANPSGST